MTKTQQTRRINSISSQTNIKFNKKHQQTFSGLLVKAIALSSAIFSPCLVSAGHKHPEPGFVDNYKLSAKGWNSPWTVMYSEEYRESRRLENLHLEEKKMAIQELFDNEEYVLLDVRSDKVFPEVDYPEKSFQFTQENKDIYGIQAKYASLKYDDVREKPYQLFKAVSDARNDDWSAHNVDESNPINPFRSQPLLILCGMRFCGCRMMFSSWYGFTNVTTLQESMDFLPGGLNSAFELD